MHGTRFTHHTDSVTLDRTTKNNIEHNNYRVFEVHSAESVRTKDEHGRQRTYNITLGRICATVVAVEKQ